MQMLKMCLNYRVLTALGAVALGIYFVAPGLLAAALPLLLIAACPLSMLFMMRAMGGMSVATAPEGRRSYTCPMHRGVLSEQPGACPSCGMPLQPNPGDAEPAQRAAGTVSGDALELQRRLDETVAEQARLSRELDALRASATNPTEMLATANRLEAEVDAALAKANRDAEAQEQLPT